MKLYLINKVNELLELEKDLLKEVDLLAESIDYIGLSDNPVTMSRLSSMKNEAECQIDMAHNMIAQIKEADNIDNLNESIKKINEIIDQRRKSLSKISSIRLSIY